MVVGESLIGQVGTLVEVGRHTLRRTVYYHGVILKQFRSNLFVSYGVVLMITANQQGVEPQLMQSVVYSLTRSTSAQDERLLVKERLQEGLYATSETYYVAVESLEIGLTILFACHPHHVYGTNGTSLRRHHIEV